MAADSPKDDIAAMMGHAVALLNNHVPALADRYVPYELGQERGELVRHYTPTPVIHSLAEACEAAAKFLVREFTKR